VHRGRPFGGIVVAGAVGAGLVLSHWLAYLIAVPHAHERERVLESTGHGYWPLAAAVAAALGLVALVVTGSRAVVQARDADLGQQRLRYLVVRLAAMQIPAFVLLEAIESIASGTASLDVALQAPFLVGLGLQLIVATALAVLLSRFARAAARIARFLLRGKLPVRSPALPPPARPAALPARLLGLAPAGVRGPPAA
jgi:L-lactate permease